MTFIHYFYSWKGVNYHSRSSVGQSIVFLKFPQFYGFRSRDNFDHIFYRNHRTTIFPQTRLKSAFKKKKRKRVPFQKASQSKRVSNSKEASILQHYTLHKRSLFHRKSTPIYRKTRHFFCWGVGVGQTDTDFDHFKIRWKNQANCRRRQ